MTRSLFCKRYLMMCVVLALSLSPGISRATLNIFATVPEWGALAQLLGTDKVRVFVATTAQQDAHNIQARPALLARARTADLLIATGAELEAGWLPVLQRDAGNPKILPGQRGLLDASSYVQLLGILGTADRSMGHIHADGNPHIQTDARNFIPIARAITERLIVLDPAHTEHYQASLQNFLSKWEKNIERWQRMALPLSGTKVWAQHDAFLYMNAWLKLDQVGLLEAMPGVDPSIAQLGAILTRQASVRGQLILSAEYLNQNAAKWFSERAKLPLVILPFTVGGNAQSKTLEAYFDDTIERMLDGLSRFEREYGPLRTAK